MSDVPVGNAIRPVVLASWRRSREQAAPVQSSRTEVFDQCTTRKLSEQNTELLHASASVLTHARKWLSGTGAMLLLADMQGTVLRTAGDGRAMSAGLQIGLQQGGRWRERDIGTNAIGTALAVNAPVSIHAFEHFCQPIQPWSCAAAPVRDPWSGVPLGVVDISSSASLANEQSLAYATMLAQQIHAALCQRRQEQHQQILAHLLERVSDWSGHDVIAFDRRGHAIHCSAGLRLADTPLRPLVDAGGRLRVMTEQPSDQWLSALHEVWPDARWEVVRARNEWIGAWLILPGSRLKGGQGNAGGVLSPGGAGGDDVLPSSSGNRPDAVQFAAGGAFTVADAPAAAEMPAAVPGVVVRGGNDAMLSQAFSTIIGSSNALRDVVELTMQVAHHELPVLLEGETGTGKEMFAQAIHAASGRKGAFVPINCGALPQELIGSELFGYERGSFTGASPTGHAGKFEAADRGTLCLDEIGELPLNLQPYLLRVLEDQQVYRLGSHRSRAVNVRLIAMTNRQLEHEIQAGRFRQDLFFRIAVTRVFIPPLRERAEDIPALVMHFAQQSAQRHGRAKPCFTAAAMDHLVAFPWPGNIRQLRNTVERMVVLGNGGRIDVAQLPTELHAVAQPIPGGVLVEPSAGQDALAGVPSNGGHANAGGDHRPGNLKDMELMIIQRTIRQCHGNMSEAARRLGIARSTLYSRLQTAGQRA